MLGDLPERRTRRVAAATGRGRDPASGSGPREVPGLFSAVAALADATGAKVAWVPRRAGDRGAVDAGCLPNLLPGGRPVDRRRGPRRGRARPGASPTGALPAAPAATPTRSSPPRRRASSARWSSAGSTRRPGRPGGRAGRRCTRSGSWSAWRCARRAVTELRRRGAPGGAGGGEGRHASSTGRAGRAPFGRRARRQRRAARRPGARHAGRRDGRRPVHPDPGAPRAGELARAGRAPGARPRPAESRRATPSATPGPGRRCWRPGASCIDVSSLGRRRAAPGRHRPARACVRLSRRPRPQRLGVADGDAGHGAHRARARSRCRWRSPTCRTAWSGCRRNSAGLAGAPHARGRARRPRGGVGMSLERSSCWPRAQPADGPDPHPAAAGQRPAGGWS